MLSVVDPSINVTLPVGEPPDAELTVAVSVTDCPNTEGLAEEFSTLVVGANNEIFATKASGEPPAKVCTASGVVGKPPLLLIPIT